MSLTMHYTAYYCRSKGSKMYKAFSAPARWCEFDWLSSNVFKSSHNTQSIIYIYSPQRKHNEMQEIKKTDTITMNIDTSKQ